MSSTAKSPFPSALRLSIDDVGVFVLLAGDSIPIGSLLLGHKHAEGAWVCNLACSLHSGAQWTVSGMGEARVLSPGEQWTLAGQTYTILQPDAASPLLWLKSQSEDVPGLLLVAEGAGEGFELGLPGGAWELEGVRHAVAFSALESGLRIACEGGVRYSKADGEFDGARPFQEASWSGGGKEMFWNSARAGSGAPLFITLEPFELA